jgi:CTP synthase
LETFFPSQDKNLSLLGGKISIIQFKTEKKAMKYVLVDGSCCSGLGKGITSSSIAVLLQASGLNVTCIKIDPYINCDASLFSPDQHGEVGLLEDGSEVDLDCLNYERFLNISLTKDHNITTGKIYSQVIAAERRGDYLGKTVQAIPHITNAIKEWIQRAAQIPVTPDGEIPDVCFIELGGSIGDIEGMVFVEAIRQLKYEFGSDFCHVHVSLVPFISESKSKLVQNAVKELRSVGLQPDIIVCRSPKPISASVIEKISQFGMIPLQNIIDLHDSSNIYYVPGNLYNQNVDQLILQRLFRLSAITFLNRNKIQPVVQRWNGMAQILDDEKLPIVKIAAVGKYTKATDSYLSISKSFDHAAIYHRLKLQIEWIESESITTDNAKEKLGAFHGILVPGGFGKIYINTAHKVRDN